MPKYRTVPEKNEIFAKASSLAVTLHEDNENELSLYVWNRRNSSIIARYEIPLRKHCRVSLINVDPIPKLKRHRK